MGPIILCYVLSTLTLTYGAFEYNEDRMRTLVQILSNQRNKYGLKHIDVNTNNYQESNPVNVNNKRIEERADSDNYKVNPLKAFNISIGMANIGNIPPGAFAPNNGIFTKPKLRICRKKPKDECSDAPKSSKSFGEADDKCDGDECDDKHYKRQRNPSIHNDINDVIGLLIKIDRKISEYEKLIDPKGFMRDFSEPTSCSGTRCGRIDKERHVVEIVV